MQIVIVVIKINRSGELNSKARRSWHALLTMGEGCEWRTALYVHARVCVCVRVRRRGWGWWLRLNYPDPWRQAHITVTSLFEGA